jgi:hypothetical protein
MRLIVEFFFLLRAGRGGGGGGGGRCANASLVFKTEQNF